MTIFSLDILLSQFGTSSLFHVRFWLLLLDLHTCCGPLMDWNLVVRSRRQESKGEKEADIPWFTQKANKAPAWGLLCLWRPQAPSQWGEGAERLLKRVLEAQAGKWTQKASALQRNSLRERERKTRGPELWWSKGVLINMVWAYILSYKVVILRKDKD